MNAIFVDFTKKVLCKYLFSDLFLNEFIASLYLGLKKMKDSIQEKKRDIELKVLDCSACLHLIEGF